jgi:hypothetical protein
MSGRGEATPRGLRQKRKKHPSMWLSLGRTMYQSCCSYCMVKVDCVLCYWVGRAPYMLCVPTARCQRNLAPMCVCMRPRYAVGGNVMSEAWRREWGANGHMTATLSQACPKHTHHTLCPKSMSEMVKHTNGAPQRYVRNVFQCPNLCPKWLGIQTGNHEDMSETHFPVPNLCPKWLAYERDTTKICPKRISPSRISPEMVDMRMGHRKDMSETYFSAQTYVRHGLAYGRDTTKTCPKPISPSRTYVRNGWHTNGILQRYVRNTTKNHQNSPW